MNSFQNNPSIFDQKRCITITLVSIIIFISFISIFKQKNWHKDFLLTGMTTRTNANISEEIIDRERNFTLIKSKRTICILNVDIRPITCSTVNERFSSLFQKRFFISAKRYGYDYLRITSPSIPSHHDSWTKVVQLYDVFHRYDIVVLLDADAYIVNPNTSIEFLLERYNFTRNSSLLLAIDPDTAFNKDSQGRLTLNTGFIIAQNN